MTTFDKSKAPYYDTYANSSNTTQLLFNPDRPLQQRELNELQSMLSDKIKKLGDTLFREGDIVQGLDYTITQDDSTVTLAIRDGFIYLSGEPTYVAPQSVTLPKSGDQYVYATYDEVVVTGDTDKSLLDPTLGVESSFSKGADRLRTSVYLTSTPKDETSTKVFHFRDGNLVISQSQPGASRLADTLALRTFEESGHYRVEGLDISVDKTQNDKDTISALVSNGKAYVRGYRVEKPTISRISIPVSRDTKTVINETQAFDPNLGYITMFQTPVANVKSVTAPVYVKETVSRGSGMSDTLQNSNVTYIKSITCRKGDVYGTLEKPADSTHTADMSVTTGHNIKWNSGSGVVPSTGDSYQVEYYYMKDFNLGKDYKVTNLSEPDGFGIPLTAVDFRGMTGDKPAQDARIAPSVAVTYDYYLARRDVVTLDRFGEFTILRGVPNTIDQLTIVNNEDPYTLPLGYITVYPNAHTATTNSYTVTNKTFVEMAKDSVRIRTLEEEVVTMSQYVTAQAGLPPLSLRGMIGDGFINFEKADIDIFGSVDEDGSNDTRWKDDAGNIIPRVATDFSQAAITLPYKSSDVIGDLNITSMSSDPVFSNPMKWRGHVITPPYKLVTELSQPLATGTININPHRVYETQQGTLHLEPSADIWQDTKHVTVNNKTVRNMEIRRFWNHRNNAGWSKDAQFIKDNSSNISWNNTGKDWILYKDGGAISEAPSNSGGYQKSNGTAQGTTVTNGGQRTIDEAIPYMRPIEVEFTSEGMRPFDNNLFIEFNGIRVATQPLSPSTSGVESGTLRADNEGKAHGKFTIPANQPTGTVNVVLRNNEQTGSRANTTFKAIGTNTTIQDMIDTTFYQVNFIDPLAQSFQFQGDRMLASASLFFSRKAKDDNAAPVIVQIRTMSEGGNPTQKVIGQSLLGPKDIQVSKDGSIPTKFNFDDPVTLQAGQSYVIAVITNSQEYEVYFAKLGGNRVDNNAVLTTMPTGGVMFTSANAQTWANYQDQNLMFALECVQFSDGAKSTVMFDPVDLTRDDGTLPDITVSTLLSGMTPNNTSLYWEYRAVLSNESNSTDINDGNHPWSPVGSAGEYDPQALIRVIQIRATMTSSRYISPKLSHELVNINALVTGTKGTYVQKTIDLLGNGYNTVRVSYKQYVPKGTRITPKFLLWHDSEAMPKTWETFESLQAKGVPQVVPSISDPDVGGMSRVEFQLKLPASYAGATGMNKFKFRMDLESDNQFIRPRVQSLQVITTDE